MPTLIYYPVAGRGELTRLIAAVGGVELDQLPGKPPEGMTHVEFGSTGSVPLLMDGDLKINESGAIETYISLIAPKFDHLTHKQRAKDAQFCQLKETYLGSFAKPLFSMSAEDRASGAKKDEILEVIDKYFSVLEGILPDDGFINGLDFPTPADLAVLNVVEAYMPFGAVYKAASLDVAQKYPNISTHSERVKAVPAVAKAMEESATLKTAVPGF
eukprot:CAMPEP_0197274532 /NCGR_PEP_ID=MMETSP1432-20130617/12814_1 /TAXON_ID=44447 /ORGANISM="Pseudo-nitzschia delicatissima, Strain UNC1205" /LENGTH=214 /DNA_ID=CAMNT_0042740337 /DNA_START=50 /DNA_END=694 /DNA_ORIENTATION=+